MKRIAFFPAIISVVSISASLFFASCNNEGEKTTTSDTPATTTISSADTGMHHDMAPPMDTAMVDHAEAALSGTYADTAVSGSVKFDKQSDGKVKMTLDIVVAAKANKSVAVHLHEHGDCGDTAKMAHGHWNPTNAQHGKWGSGSFHSGDIGNVKLDSKGVGKLTITTDLWTLGGTAVTNIVGKSVIVHGGVDDYKTQPSGNSGTRIGCGVIR